MTGYFAAAAPYGLGLTVTSVECPEGRAAKGFISPMDAADTENLRRATRPGRLNREKYLLIAEPSAIAAGETELLVTADGKLYEVLRAEPVYAGGGIGHWRASSA
jgi:hypothetical protein